MSTSDISGNESSDGSGSFFPRVLPPRHALLLADSPTHMGDEQIFGRTVHAAKCRR